MPSIVEDVQAAAQWIGVALNASGYKADFSPSSLEEIDRFLDEHSYFGKVIPGGLLSQDLGARLFALGSYVGETIRRQVGGEWRGNDDDPEAEINVELRTPGDIVCWPMQRVMKRFLHGPDDEIAGYGIYFIHYVKEQQKSRQASPPQNEKSDGDTNSLPKKTDDPPGENGEQPKKRKKRRPLF